MTDIELQDIISRVKIYAEKLHKEFYQDGSVNIFTLGQLEAQVGKLNRKIVTASRAR